MFITRQVRRGGKPYFSQFKRKKSKTPLIKVFLLNFLCRGRHLRFFPIAEVFQNADILNRLGKSTPSLFRCLDSLGKPLLSLILQTVQFLPLRFKKTKLFERHGLPKSGQTPIAQITAKAKLDFADSGPKRIFVKFGFMKSSPLLVPAVLTQFYQRSDFHLRSFQ